MGSNYKELTKEKSNGRIYTPEFIVNNILDLASYYGSNILHKHVIDNSCGDGAFLTKIVERYCKESIANNFSKGTIAEELSIYIHGIEIDECECIKCINNVDAIANTYGITGIKWDIICADTMTVTKYEGKMDFVLGNPPYIRVHNLGESFEKIKKFSFAQNGMTDLYIVFYEIGIKMLNSSGTLGYITPSSFFNSIAGKHMRNELVCHNYVKKLVDLKHFQAFSATTYTTIVILGKNNGTNLLDYYQFDDYNLIPYYVESLTPNDYYIAGNFYFSNRKNLAMLKKILFNLGHSDISVKNGYATLCDDVFINKFSFKSKYIIPVIKSSRGIIKTIIYPYNEKGKLITENELKEETDLYNYLIQNKNKLTKRSNENSNIDHWYAFGRSQAINDTYKDKISINSLIRNVKDLKIIDAPKGTGIYSGLYLISNTIDSESIKKVLVSSEFVEYVSLLGKYKSGGYYTFSSKDVKAYVDYKFSYNGGLAE